MILRLPASTWSIPACLNDHFYCQTLRDNVFCFYLTVFRLDVVRLDSITAKGPLVARWLNIQIPLLKVVCSSTRRYRSAGAFNKVIKPNYMRWVYEWMGRARVTSKWRRQRKYHAGLFVLRMISFQVWCTKTLRSKPYANCFDLRLYENK